MNSKIFSILSIVLLLFVSVNATHTTQYEGECSLISVQNIDVKLQENTSTLASTTISNFSRERFYIDYIGLETHGSAHANLVKQPGWISSVGYGTISISLFAPPYEVGSTDVVVNVRGHFEDDTICLSHQVEPGLIEVQSFKQPVYVSGLPNGSSYGISPINRHEILTDADCSLFSTVVPTSATADNGTGKISFFVSNNSSKRAELLLIGSNIEPETGVFSIPTGVQKEYTVFYDLKGNAGELAFVTNLDNCAIEEKTTQIRELFIQNPPIKPQEPVKPTNTVFPERLAFNTQIILNPDFYTVKVKLTNLTGETVNPIVWFDLPNNWEIEGNNNKVVLNGGIQEFEFKITPNEKTINAQIAAINISNRDLILTNSVSFPALQEVEDLQPVGLFTLGGTVFQGLLLLLLILLILGFALTRNIDYSKYRVWNRESNTQN